MTADAVSRPAVPRRLRRPVECGFAKLTLQDELVLSNAAFVFGQVAFFLAYAGRTGGQPAESANSPSTNG